MIKSLFKLLFTNPKLQYKEVPQFDNELLGKLALKLKNGKLRYRQNRFCDNTIFVGDDDEGCIHAYPKDGTVDISIEGSPFSISLEDSKKLFDYLQPLFRFSEHKAYKERRAARFIEKLKK